MTKIKLIKQAIIAKQSVQYRGSSHTKTRGEVRGGGAKPWKQKGTGRARAGSRRSPIWIGGGITFGPLSKDNGRLKLPKRMNQAAFKAALEMLQESKSISTQDSLALKEPKTKLAIKMLTDLGLDGEKVLLITEKTEPELILATANIPGVRTINSSGVSLLDLVSATKFVFESKVLAKYFPTTVKAKSKPKTASKKIKEKSDGDN
ncbi:50S ribosomal protein L4 [Candidatus Berkelbacteria bacterium RIFCSPLOWO2_01_FULL_50_28]|uniref:Large ribosomal subunit protein uL4 n=1 Tax=Candidatus Berkelbacteria bacterium RIFCSPLOWO2_01_FULL_50_28 TaxID=1797471 RepID=A0A1F5ECC0_9BACT|nr:MAG: 50S ribosomal protein L4 [Candidatus Berkelbacteria bacterium RIFCSPHIGHO2_01_FULL_50_36]OGD62273.1 MAG: 50S ribosomal protein L4 [Candidatus Berkelbacteria bacterium RIFCSPHIGHO2_12_FULL_50_11]OGD64916.1 MAG: 50S ribosomal protein L4 [Candidatus Berkelbacteria bacterium RIFCSPLOWO2_01_FULL_50_28]